MHGGDLFEAIARVGYGARGLVYLIVAAIAVLAGFGSSGEVAGTEGAAAPTRTARRRTGRRG